jgi:outer membrane protein insertion porin family
MKYFEEVEAYHKISNGKNILLFKLKEKPIIGKISFSGNDEINDDDLKEQIKTKEFNILDVSTLKNDLLLLQKHYEEKGYFLALANYQIKDNKNGSVDLKFIIKEWDKVRVKKITFLGNKKILDQELKNFMQTREESYFSFLSGSGNFKEINFQTDVERLKYYYKTRGHLQVNIQNPEVTASEDKKWIFITVRIEEGPQFTVNDISFNGELLFEDKEMNKKLKLKNGDIYNEENLRLDIQTLTEMYLEINNIGDDGVSALVLNLSHTPNLNYLNINTNNIGNDGAKKLKKYLPNNPKLKHFHIYGNVMSEKNLEKLIK